MKKLIKILLFSTKKIIAFHLGFKSSILNKRNIVESLYLFDKISSYNIKLGLSGKDGEEGRKTVQKEYVELLSKSKIVVHCSPDGWEGDYRTMEAISSGALVLTNKLINPHPWFEDKKNIVYYNSISHMFRLINYYLLNENKAKEIVNNYRIYSPESLVRDILSTLSIKNKINYHFIKPTKENQQGEYLILEKAFKKNLQLNEVEVFCAEFIFIDYYRNKDNIDDILKNINLTKDNKTKIIILDWSDSPYEIYDKYKVDYYFKRSLVCREKNITLNHKIPIHKLYYPLKEEFKKEMDFVRKNRSSRDNRSIDVSCLFKFDPF